jgi:hypothetical protein
MERGSQEIHCINIIMDCFVIIGGVSGCTGDMSIIKKRMIWRRNCRIEVD